MNDTMDKTTSSLAIVEKKPRKTGGCVGIFFQLFDWNRRFAKKKLFPKKLLPPVRLSKGSEKNGRDEKQAKLRLIADENCGGFPTKKNCGSIGITVERKHEMRAPSLVARLMGLESMPALQRDKSKKVQPSRSEKCTVCECLEDELNVEERGNKRESRPQKLQKTNFREKLGVTTIGTETLPFKNVLSKPRKHYPKLPSPVKSPRNHSKTHASKLIGAATRILEPGLHSSRAKSALPYTSTLNPPPQLERVLDNSKDMPSDEVEHSVTYSSIALRGHSSCPNCGHSMNKLCTSPCAREHLPIYASLLSHGSRCPCRGLERSNHTFSRNLEKELLDHPSVVNLPMNYERPCDKNKPEKCSFSERGCETRMNAPSSLDCSLENPSLNHCQVLNSSSPCPKLKVSSSGLARSSAYVKTDNKKFEMESRIGKRISDVDVHGRKRRPVNLSTHGESSGTITLNKQKHSIPHRMSGREMGCNTQHNNHQSGRSGIFNSQESRSGGRQVDSNNVSFTFHSPSKQRTGSPIMKRMDQSYLTCGGASHKSGFTQKNGRTGFEKPFSVNGDALGALLEQKLKELTYQGEDNAPQKTTAMILQELISALTTDVPFELDKFAASKSCDSLQANTMKVKPSVDQPPNNEHLSPGSVLEPFSSDTSCLSSTLSDNCGYQKLPESVKSITETHLLNHDMENLDSLPPTNATKSCKQLVANIINNVSEILRLSHLANCGLEGTKLIHAKNVLLNAELIFGNADLSGLIVQKSFSVKQLLVEELETLATVLWMNFGCSVGAESSKEANQLRRFALDSIIEYLDTRFDGYPYSGSLLSAKLPLPVNTSMLIFEIVKEVRKWIELSRVFPDELLEWEMSLSVGKWTQFEDERSEMAMEMSNHMLQLLVEEIMMDS